MIDLERTDYDLEEKLKKQQYKEIWQQYCGFLDLSMNGIHEDSASVDGGTG